MSESLSDTEWWAEQQRRFRRQMDDLEQDRERRRQMAALERDRWERSNRRVLGFIPGEVWDLWPTLIVTSVIGGVVGFGVSELLVHHFGLVAACR